MRSRNSKLAPVLRAMNAFTASAQAEPQPQGAVTCHKCGAVVDGDALAVQTAADGTPKLDVFLCRAHLIAGTERLQAAIRAQREGQGE